MKNFLFALSAFFVIGVSAQPVADCSMMCVLDIQLDTVNNEMEVLLFSGDTNHINYPTIQVIDQNGDTVGNPQGNFYYFAHPTGTLLHEIPTTLTTLPNPFYCTVLVTDQVWDTTCYFQYPMSCPMNVGEQPALQEVSMYPNPATDFLTIALPAKISGKVEIEIANVLGEVFCGSVHATNGRIELDVSDMAGGVYFVSVLVGEERYTQRIIVRG